MGHSGQSSIMSSNRMHTDEEYSAHSSALNYRESPGQFNSLSSKKNLRN